MTWRCICTWQGGAPYVADCPIHDEHVNTNDIHWYSRYYKHIKAQRKIKERLGW